MPMSEQEWIDQALKARRRQGLPTRVKDPIALRRIAKLMAKKTRTSEGPGSA